MTRRAAWRVGWELRGLRRGASEQAHAVELEHPHWSELCGAEAHSVGAADGWRTLAPIEG